MFEPKGGGVSGGVGADVGDLPADHFPPARFRFTDQTLDLSGEAPGVLHGWYRASTGEWFGLVSFTILYAGATRTPGPQLDNQLVPAEALRPRKYGAERRR